MDILYLVPVQGSRATETALLMQRNRQSVAHVNDRAVEGSGYDCVSVGIKDHVTSEWTFKVGNNDQCDFFISCRGNDHIELVFYFGGHPEHISLMMRNNSSMPARILDPINNDEEKSEKMETVPPTSIRFLQRPSELIIGPYHFLIQRPSERTGTAATALEIRKRQILHLIPLEEPEDDWRPTNEILGSGSYGEVRCMRGMRTGFTMARKRTKGRLAVFQKTKNEMEILKKLSHKNIIECIGFEEAIIDNWYYLSIMMPIYATDLERLMRQNRGKKIFDILFPQIMDGVAYLHENGIVHRDLKPANIMSRSLKRPYSVAINDFGLSKAVEGECNTQCGTIEYLAPEVATNSAVTGKVHYGFPADIFSCGVIGFEMLKPEKYSELLAKYELRRNGDTTSLLALHQDLRQACAKISNVALSILIPAMMAEAPMARPKASDVVVALRDPNRFLRHGFGSLPAIQEEEIWVAPAQTAVLTSKKRADFIHEQQQAALNAPVKSIFGGGNAPTPRPAEVAAEPRVNTPSPARSKAQAPLQAKATAMSPKKTPASPQVDMPRQTPDAPANKESHPATKGKAQGKNAERQQTPAVETPASKQASPAPPTQEAIPESPQAAPKETLVNGSRRLPWNCAHDSTLTSTTTGPSTIKPRKDSLGLELIAKDEPVHVNGSRRLPWNCVHDSTSTSAGPSTIKPSKENAGPEGASKETHPINGSRRLPWNCAHDSTSTSVSQSDTTPKQPTERICTLPRAPARNIYKRTPLHPLNPNISSNVHPQANTTAQKLSGRGTRRIDRAGLLETTLNHKRWVQKVKATAVVRTAWISVSGAARKVIDTGAAIVGAASPLRDAFGAGAGAGVGGRGLFRGWKLYGGLMEERIGVEDSS